MPLKKTGSSKVRHEVCGRLYDVRTYARIYPYCYPDQAKEIMSVKAQEQVAKHSRNRLRNRPVPLR